MALIAGDSPEVLPQRIRRAIEAGPAFLSVVAYWEVMIKSMRGTLAIEDAPSWFDRTLDYLALQPLLLRPEHIDALAGLPPIHQDPFDRILIAQAVAEDLTLLTTDKRLASYASSRFRLIR